MTSGICAIRLPDEALLVRHSFLTVRPVRDSTELIVEVHSPAAAGRKLYAKEVSDGGAKLGVSVNLT